MPMCIGTLLVGDIAGVNSFESRDMVEPLSVDVKTENMCPLRQNFFET